MKTAELKILLESLRRPHLEIEDCWYSCPLSGECCNYELEDSCNCGATAHNEKIDKAIVAITEGKST